MIDYNKELVKFWQRQQNISEDGILGPLTKSSIREILGVRSTSAMLQIINHASYDLGEQEEGRNGGVYVTDLRAQCGFPTKRRGPWCAIFVSAMLLNAGINDIKLSRGAYRLVQNIGNSDRGRFIEVPEQGFACWTRGRLLKNFRPAHIRIIEDYDAATDTMTCIAGNERNAVRRVSLRNGAWRKNLINMSTIV